MAKPILTVGLPSGTFKETINSTSDRLNCPKKGLSKEYHILCYAQTNGEEIKFEVFYEKDFTEVQYEELKQIIINNISKKEDEQTTNQN